jgi:hypothetical protein
MSEAASTGEILAGFLPPTARAVGEAGPVTPEFLAGTWSADDYSRIVFRQEGGRTLASGSATYGEGASTNMGEFEGELALDGPRFSYGRRRAARSPACAADPISWSGTTASAAA